MRHFLFNDEETGEDFIIGAENGYDATMNAAGLFNRPKFLCELTEEEAENSGVDEY